MRNAKNVNYVKNLIKMVFIQPNISLSLFFLCTQQGLVAASTYFSIQLTSHLVTNNDYVFYVFMFFVSLLLNYLPGILYSIHLEKGICIAKKKVTSQFVKHHNTAIEKYTSITFRQKQEPWLTHEGPWITQEILAQCFNSLSLGLNILLNMLVIGFTLDNQFLLAYFFSLCGMLFIMHQSRHKIQKMATIAQKSKNRFQACLLSGWDNILINNTYNFMQWNSNFNQRWQKYTKYSINYASSMSIYSALAMITALFPIFLLIVFHCIKNSSNLALLTTMLMLLPRQLLIIQNSYQFFSICLQWIGIYTKFKNLAFALNKPYSATQLTKYIQWQALQIHDEKNQKIHINSKDKLFELLHKKAKGRITIIGKNGSGKSSLLRLIKKSAAEPCFYLPTQHNLQFKDYDRKYDSTGQRARQLLTEIQQKIKTPWILLDEWDANLDSENILLLSKKIDDLAKKHLILEVRHSLNRI